MNFAEKSYGIFEQSVADYHIDDDVDAATRQPYAPESIEGILYAKNRIDAVQWHLEDIIRDPDIDPVEALALKRRIDRSNQERTDMVEELDSYFRTLYSGVEVAADATINTESPAWALDRLSILALKIYHMAAEAGRADASEEHRARCAAKLAVLEEQRTDLVSAIGALLDDIAAGRKYMKVYRQMKMYNDADTNPVLYGAK
ncbi:MAG: DUF4254 domain-containing protein [Muribaculaceae bacterium]|jgi:hypothetical protein|nr:DUF4254 domain-containing protein [Muribaculaceae bacterium]